MNFIKSHKVEFPRLQEPVLLKLSYVFILFKRFKEYGPYDKTCQVLFFWTSDYENRRFSKTIFIRHWDWKTTMKVSDSNLLESNSCLIITPPMSKRSKYWLTFCYNQRNVRTEINTEIDKIGCFCIRNRFFLHYNRTKPHLNRKNKIGCKNVFFTACFTLQP